MLDCSIPRFLSLYGIKYYRISPMINHILSVKFGTLDVELLIKNAAIIGVDLAVCGSLTDAAPFHFMRHEIKQKNHGSGGQRSRKSATLPKEALCRPRQAQGLFATSLASDHE